MSKTKIRVPKTTTVESQKLINQAIRRAIGNAWNDANPGTNDEAFQDHVYDYIQGELEELLEFK